jgi:hypothetical protein
LEAGIGTSACVRFPNAANNFAAALKIFIHIGGMKLQFALRRSTSLLRGQPLAAPGDDRMVRSGPKGMIGIFVAGSMILSSSAAVAATQPTSAPQADPWAVLSVMNGGAAAAAVCGAAAAAAATAAAQAAAPGCVLPAVDAPPAVAQAGPPPPIPVPPVEPAGAGLGISPLILGLAALAAALGLYLALHHGHGNSPA